MGALADGDDGRLGRADEAHDLRVLELGMVAQEPEDGVRPVLAARHGRVARTALRLDLGHLDLGLGELQAIGGVLLGLGDLVAGELAGGDRVHALDAVRHVAVGDALHLEHVQAAEFGDLLEGERGVVDQPDGGRFGHQGGTVHDGLNTCKNAAASLAPFRRESQCDEHEGEWALYRVPLRQSIASRAEGSHSAAAPRCGVLRRGPACPR